MSSDKMTVEIQRAEPSAPKKRSMAARAGSTAWKYRMPLAIVGIGYLAFVTITTPWLFSDFKQTPEHEQAVDELAVEIDELSGEVDELTILVDNITDVVNELQAVVDVLQDENDVLTGLNNDLVELNDQFSEENQQLNESVETFTQLNIQLAKDTAAFIIQNEQLNQSIQELNVLNVQLEANVATLEANLQVLETQEQALETENEALLEELANLQNTTAALSALIPPLQEQVDALAANVTVLQTQNDRLQAEADQLGQTVSFLEADSGGSEEIYDQLAADLADSIAANRNLLIGRTRYAKTQRVTNWDCDFANRFGSQAFMDNVTAPVGADEYQDVIDYVDGRVLVPICAQKVNFENFLVSVIMPPGSTTPTTVTFNELSEGVDIYTGDASVHYFDNAVTGVGFANSTGVTQIEWADASYDCDNLLDSRKFVYFF
eukprot:scaffold2680_cov57-Attheya_sp.AAC.4